MICIYEGRFYGDTRSINQANKLGVVEHLGFGDFRVTVSPHGTITWRRCVTPWEGIREGWCGRTHVLSGTSEALTWLFSVLVSLHFLR